jgi:DHA1 family tetracycline resistance protein-like MFS transporter
MNRKAKGILFITVLIDMIGLGIIIPFVPIIFDLQTFFPTDFSAQNIHIILGLLLASYPFAQFFGSPVLGRLSDNHGRKNILTLSLIGSLIGYFVFAWGIQASSLWLLFASRLIDGFTGGNISVAMAAIADISRNEKEKVRNFGMIGAAFGLGFIIGPALGGLLSDSHISPYFTIETPFMGAGILAFINFNLVHFALPETLKNKKKRKINFKDSFNNLRIAFSLKQLRTVFLALFLVNLGWVLFEYFFQVFLYTQFHLTASTIAFLFVYIGFWIVLSQGYLVRKVSGKVAAPTLLKFTLLPASLFLFLVAFSTKSQLYYFLPFLAVFMGFTQPNFSAILSESTAAQSQGEILGIRQSVVSSTQFIAPLIGGFLLNLDHQQNGSRTPLLAGSIIIFIGWIFVLLIKKATKKLSFERN